MNPPAPTKIVCVGRNYVAHAKELGNEMPERPLIFLKPPSSLIRSGETIRLPAESKQVDHEAEIAAIIRTRCARIAASDALDFVGWYAPLNDVTAAAR